jgi:hypothetical protein
MGTIFIRKLVAPTNQPLPHQFQPKLTANCRCSFAQCVQCYGVIVWVEQSVEGRPAGVHPPRISAFEKFLSFMAAAQPLAHSVTTRAGDERRDLKGTRQPKRASSVSSIASTPSRRYGPPLFRGYPKQFSPMWSNSSSIDGRSVRKSSVMVTGVFGRNGSAR